MRFRIALFLTSFLLTVLVLAVPGSSARADATEDLRQIEALHAKGDSASALTQLEASNLKTEQPALYYYNRGVLLHATGQFGLAVASLEKARTLAPGRTEVHRALEASRTELSRTLGPARLDAASTTGEKVGEEIPFEPFVIFFAGLSFLGLLITIVKKRSWKSRMAMLTGANLTLLFGFLIWKQWMADHPAAVVIQGVTLRSGPGADYLDLGTLDVGMKVRRLSEDQGWLKIRYSRDGGAAFVPRESVLLLRDGSTS